MKLSRKVILSTNYFLIITMVLFTLSCTKNKGIEPFNENIRIRMYENTDSNNRSLVLNCYTEKIFVECSNYSIERNVEIHKNKIVVNFIVIHKPNVCLTSIGPATTVIELKNLPNDNYVLEFNLGNIKIEGNMIVSDDEYKVTLPVQDRIQFDNPKMNRIPANTIYGTIRYHAVTTEPLAQNFLDSLLILGANESIYNPGDYVNFIIQNNGQVFQRQDEGYYFSKYFVFNYNRNSNDLRTLVKNFGLTYPDLVTITLNTTKGEIFYSWN